MTKGARQSDRHRILMQCVTFIVALIGIIVPVKVACAANVSVDVSSRNVYVGIPFSLTIKITSADDFDDPQFTKMEGIRVVGGPSKNQMTQMTTVNGRMTQQNEVSLTYSLMVDSAGDYVIPPISVTADGTLFRSPPIAIRATVPSADEGFHVEVTADKERIYLGEPLNLTLHIYIKPFADQNLRVQLNDTDMWSMISLDTSRWGVFHSAVENAVGPRLRSIEGRDVERTLPDGTTQPYYLYEFEVTDWPMSAGPIQLPETRIVIQYPVRLERRRDIFVQGLAVAQAKPMVITPTMPNVVVLTPPAAEQPDVYSGAVGRFDINVDASPTQVAVGDPVTITMTVRDLAGSAKLELLSPPPLNRMTALTKDFRVPTEPMTGAVTGNTKTFRQTIRPNSANVQELPPLEFVYFDPDQEEYITLRSAPIPMNVEPAKEVSATDVVGGANPRTAESSQLTELEGGILANKAGAAMLLGDDRFRPGWFYVLILALPPVGFAAVTIHHRRARKLREDEAARRARSAAKHARKRLNDANKLNGGAQADAVAAALSGYVADRTAAQAESMTRDDVLVRLQSWRASPEVINDVEALLATCDELRYGSNGGAGENSIVERAGRCIDRLEKRRSA